MPQDLKALLRTSTDIVREAGELVRSHWTKPRHIEHKGRIDLVTETDKAVEALLKERLAELLPEADFLAEESAGQTEPGELTWIIDPVDGTTNFAHGHPALAISVGLWRKDRMVLGIVYNPIQDDLFQAARGLGAWNNGRDMRVSLNASLERSLVATGFPYAIQERVDEVLAMLREALLATQGVRRCGAAALDLAYVAAGRVDAFYELGLSPWDTAAGWLLVEEAGGRVSRLDGREYCLRADGILASNGLIHEAMQRLLARA